MEKTVKVTYLYNSGFVVELGTNALIFDYYTDKADCLSDILQKYKSVYFFVSHSHFDHWNPAIGKFSQNVRKYFLSYDIHNMETLPGEKTVVMNEYDEYKSDMITVKSYSSTDAGISFLVSIEGWNIFHAGDFNWWHWKGDTEKNNAFAKNGFLKQMKKIAGMEADIAFFPVDRRLEEYCDWGVKEFCRQTNVDNIIAMHNAGRQAWPLKTNASDGRHINVWSPELSGETIIIKKDR
ncbi:MBL fold metallo-hydrolase [Pectinatus haikarae]|uniref:MBL fold metallo-hydrolase n=1 Tax=Pectinatus haikarae TaxID=349096 RepID=UPI0018C80424